jgi:hypothetical protein
MSDITLNTAAANAPEAAPRTAPLSQVGLVGWVRANLFSGWLNSAVTLVLAYLLTGQFKDQGEEAALDFMCEKRSCVNPNNRQIAAAVEAARTFAG